MNTINLARRGILIARTFDSLTDRRMSEYLREVHSSFLVMHWLNNGMTVVCVNMNRWFFLLKCMCKKRAAHSFEVILPFIRSSMRVLVSIGMDSGGLNGGLNGKAVEYHAYYIMIIWMS